MQSRAYLTRALTIDWEPPTGNSSCAPGLNQVCIQARTVNSQALQHLPNDCVVSGSEVHGGVQLPQEGAIR